jgi:hypothetical protein
MKRFSRDKSKQSQKRAKVYSPSQALDPFDDVFATKLMNPTVLGILG